jgi:hypothetical protein
VAEVKSEVISLRIDHEIVDALKQEASFKHVSMNVLTNSILRNYVEWERDAERTGFMPITKHIFSSLLQKISDEELEKIAFQSKNDVRTQIIYMEKKYDLGSFLEWLRRWCDASDFSEKEFYQNNTLICIIQHGLGLKWSIYLKTLVKVVLDDLTQMKVDFDSSSSMLIFRIVTEKQLGSTVLEPI